MEPSSTSFARLRSDILAARDLRDRVLKRVLANQRRTVILLSLNLPGPAKSPMGSLRAFRWAHRRVMEIVPGVEDHFQEIDTLGPFALLSTPESAEEVKRICIALEEEYPLARLVDADVYTPDGRGISRTDLGIPPRRCLLCEHDAVECMRLSRHTIESLVERSRELLADIPD